jgi:hypothetical protein
MVKEVIGIKKDESRLEDNEERKLNGQKYKIKVKLKRSSKKEAKRVMTDGYKIEGTDRRK